MLTKYDDAQDQFIFQTAVWMTAKFDNFIELQICAFCGDMSCENPHCQNKFNQYSKLHSDIQSC